MDKDNYITIEMTFRCQVKDYRVVLGIKRSWIFALVLLTIKLALWAHMRHYV